MAKFDFDMFTIGAGSGGVASSRRAGSYGARVAIGEDSRVGELRAIDQELLRDAAADDAGAADAAVLADGDPRPI